MGQDNNLAFSLNRCTLPRVNALIIKNMTKQEKIASLTNSMTQSEREGGEKFYHFTDEAPKGLKDEFLKHYNVNNLDYQMFSTACDIVSEIYHDIKENDAVDAVEEMIYERCSDSASIITYDRISDIMHEYGELSIATACAIWYDKQVEQAAIIIKDWVNAEVGSIRKSYCKDAGEEVEQELQSNGEWLCLHK